MQKSCIGMAERIPVVLSISV